jgi:hypothetical protein
MRRTLAALSFLLLLVVACQAGAGPVTPPPSPTPGPPEMLPIQASSELAVGPNRFLFALTDRDNKPLAAPGVTVHLLFYDVDVSKDAVAVMDASGRVRAKFEGTIAADELQSAIEAL